MPVNQQERDIGVVLHREATDAIARVEQATMAAILRLNEKVENLPTKADLIARDKAIDERILRNENDIRSLRESRSFFYGMISFIGFIFGSAGALVVRLLHLK